MSASTSFERSSLYTIHSSLFDAHRIDRYRRNTFDEEDCQFSFCFSNCIMLERAILLRLPHATVTCVLLCVVTLLGRKRGHWLTKPAANEDPVWQQERPTELHQNLCLRLCRGKRRSNAPSSLTACKTNRADVVTTCRSAVSKSYFIREQVRPLLNPSSRKWSWVSEQITRGKYSQLQKNSCIQFGND